MNFLAAMIVILLLSSCSSKQGNTQADYQRSALDNWVQRQEGRYGHREPRKHVGKYDVAEFAKNLNASNATLNAEQSAEYLVKSLEAVPKMKPALRKEFDYEIEGAFYGLKNAVLDFSILGNLEKEGEISNKMLSLAKQIWGADSRMVIVAMAVRADYLKRAKKEAEYAKVVEQGLELSRHYKLAG
jgi:hypothetical protein